MTLTAGSGAADPWMAVSASLTKVVDTIAIRRDLVVSMVASDPRAAGVFDHLGASITLDASRLLPGDVDPASLDFDDLRNLARYPVVAGCLAHESAHADHTVMRGAQRAAVGEWAALLEEPRIETIMARRQPRTRTWLQASVAHILGEVAPTSDVEAARALILIGGRLLGGVLDPSDDLDLDAACGEWLTPEQVAVIAGATAVAVELADGDIAGLIGQAERIEAVMPNLTPPPVDDGDGHTGHQPPRDDQGAQSRGGGTAGEGAPGRGDRSGHDTTTPGTSAGPDTTTKGSPSDSNNPVGDRTDGRGVHGDSPATPAGQKLARALVRAADDAATQMRAAAGILGPSKQAQQRAAAAHTRAKVIAASARRATQTKHHVVDRKATPAEQRHATRLINQVRRAADRGVDVTRERTQTPPGSLITSELVQRAAQRAMRTTVSATPWEQTIRRERPQPKLTVGIAADISPSQDSVADQVGVVAWMINRVAHDRGGRAATVTWHSSVAALPTKKGGTVPVPETDGASSALPEALRALDGLLNLNGDRGPRLVVVITDSLLPNPGEIHAEAQRLIASGVKILWLIDRYNPGRSSFVKPPSEATAVVITDPERLGDLISEAMVAALRS